MTNQGPTIAPAPEAPARPDGSPPPRSRPSTRAHRRAALRQRRRRRLAAFALLVALTVGGVFTGVGPELVSEGFRRLVPSGDGERALSQPESLMVAWPIGGGDGAVIALAGVEPRSDEASVLLVPSDTQIEVPSLGSDTFGGALRIAGPDSVALALENALGVRVKQGAEFDEVGLRALLTAAGPLDVRLREPVVFGETVYPGGVQRLAPADAIRLVTERVPETSTFDHLVTVHAVLEGWLDALGPEPFEGLRDALQEGGLGNDDAERGASLLAALAERDVTFDTLSVDSLGAPGAERYQVATGAVDDVVRMFPGLTIGAGAERPRIEILNGTGAAGLARQVAAQVVPAGFRVVLTGNAAEFGVEKTLMVLHDERRREQAQKLIDELGVGELRMARNPVGVVDVSIVVGADFSPGGD